MIHWIKNNIWEREVSMSMWEVADFLDKWGVKVGLGMTAAPLVYDLVMLGGRGFAHWNIGRWGCLCLLMGWVITITSYMIRRRFGGN